MLIEDLNSTNLPCSFPTPTLALRPHCSFTSSSYFYITHPYSFYKGTHFSIPSSPEKCIFFFLYSMFTGPKHTIALLFCNFYLFVAAFVYYVSRSEYPPSLGSNNISLLPKFIISFEKYLCLVCWMCVCPFFFFQKPVKSYRFIQLSVKLIHRGTRVRPYVRFLV